MRKQALELYHRIDAQLLYGDKPSEYLTHLVGDPDFEEYPFTLLLRLCDTEQSSTHHPEGSAWKHTMLVADLAAAHRRQSRSPRVFMWAALLHDIGKPLTTKRRAGRITSYDHDRTGAELTRGFLSEFAEDPEFIENTALLVRYHMHVLYVLRDLPFKDMRGLLTLTDIREVALLALCDRLGRGDADEQYEKLQIRAFLERCAEENINDTTDVRRNRYGKSRYETARPKGAARH